MTKRTIKYCFLFLPLLIYAQDISIANISKEIQLIPGNSYSLVYKISNNSTKEINITPEIELPKDWKSTTGLTNFNIHSLSNDIQVLGIHIPSSAEFGTFEITNNLTDSETKLNYSIKSLLSVSEIKKISLEPLNTPLLAKAGDTIFNSFILKNEGNSFQNIQVYSETDLSIPKQNFLLKADEVMELHFKKITNSKLSKLAYNTVKITAQLESDSLVQANSYARTKVIPIIESNNDIYKRYPIYVSATYIARDRTTEGFEDGFQGEIKGSGAINKENTRYVSFRSLGPDQFNLTSYGNYEEHYINYTSEKLFAHIGDKSYSSSQLTEFSRYGRGAELIVTSDNLEIGGFYNKPRFFEGIEDEFSVFTKINLNKSDFIKAGYLQKRMSDDIDADLIYITSKITPFKNTSIEGEYSTSKTSEDNGKAYMAQIQGNYQKGGFNFMYLSADKKYSGFYNNTNFLNTNGRLRITSKLNLNANYYKDARNIERDTLYGVKPYSERYNAGLTFNYLKSGYIGLYAGFNETNDRADPAQFHYEEKYARLNISQELGDLEINVEGNFGTTYNHIYKTEAKSTLLGLNFSLTKFNSILNIFGNYQNSNRYEESNEEQYFYGGSLFSQISPKLNLRLLYRNSYSIEEYYRDRSLAEINLNYRVARNHELSFITRSSLAQNQIEQKDLSLFLKYTVRINAPIKKIASYGILQGKIENLGIATVTGIKLKLHNKIAISDEYGNFIFKNIVPGDYLLELDKENLDINVISTINLPQVIKIEEDENYFEFGLIKSGSLKGSVKIGNLEDDQEKYSESEEQIIIELKQGSEIIRKIASIRNNFQFHNLRPGEWDVKIYRNGLNKAYKINIETYKIEIKPNTNTPLEIGITKRKRVIQFLQQTLSISQNE